MSQAAHIRHTPSLEPERWQALAAEANTTLPGNTVAVDAAELRQLLDHSRALPNAEAQVQRLYPLVRYMRVELHEAKLIDSREYADLSQLGGSRILDTYDELRKRAEAATSRATKAESRVQELKGEMLDILRDMRLPRLPLPPEENEDGELNWEHNLICGQNKERQAINDYCRQKAYEYDRGGIGPDPTEVGQWDTRPAAPTPPPSSPVAAGPQLTEASAANLARLDYWRYQPGAEKPQVDGRGWAFPDNPTAPAGWNVYTGPALEYIGSENLLCVTKIEPGEIQFDQDDLIEDPNWFSPLAFDTPADYDASVAHNVERIKSGEVKPIERKKPARKQSGQFVVKVPNCGIPYWFAPWAGDPGRTLIKENAKRFKTQEAATAAIERVYSKYPWQHTLKSAVVEFAAAPTTTGEGKEQGHV